MGLNPEDTKSPNCISTTLFIPAIDSPIPTSTIADSQIGVFRMRSFPNCYKNPSVILNAPPYSAMSCPIIISNHHGAPNFVLNLQKWHQ